MAEKTLTERDKETAELITNSVALGRPHDARAFSEGVLLGALSSVGYTKTAEAFRVLHRNQFRPTPTERTDDGK